MHLTEDRDFNLRRRTRVVIGNLYSDGLVMESIAREIFHNIRVAYYKSTTLSRHKQWGMLNRVFHIFMQCWMVGRWITRNLLSRWTTSFVIKLFLFLMPLDISIVMLILTWWISVVCLKKCMQSLS